MPEKLDDKPIIELAKSGRASCRTCRRKIVKEEIRIGIPYTFTRPDGGTITSFGYYHVDCAPRNKIETILEVLVSSSEINSDNKLKISKSLEKRKKEDTQLRDNAKRRPFLEQSKSSRGACKICEKKITKGDLRVAEPSLVELDDGRKFFSHKFYHFNCYIESSTDAKSLFEDLLQTSLQKKSISQEEADSLEKDFHEVTSSEETAAEVLLLITEEPIDIETLKQFAKEKRIPFKKVNVAIQNGLLKGTFFIPKKGTIQRL